MPFESQGKKLHFACTNTYLQALDQFIDGTVIPMLSDESSALVLVSSDEQVESTEQIAERLPEKLRGVFSEFLSMRTARGKFFNRFVLFLRPPIDGILIGYGRDEGYYILVVWDFLESHYWIPSTDINGKRVIK